MVRPTFFYRPGHALHRAGIPILPNLLRRLCFLICHADIPMGCKIGKNVQFAHWGLGVVLNEVVEIADNVIIYQHVTIGRSRGIDDPNPAALKRIAIGRNTLIGAHAVLLAKNEEMIIGENCEIAAGAVVLDSVPAGMIAAGVPARCFPRGATGPPR
jgi:serine O-acetyltransferase